MMKFVVYAVLLVSVLFVGVQCKPIEADKEEPAAVAKPKILQPGDTYTKAAEMYEPSGSGSGDDEDGAISSSSDKIFCPPDFIEMWVKVYKEYPEKCMIEGTHGGSSNDESEETGE